MTADLETAIVDYRRRRDGLALFDANCWLGDPLTPAFAPTLGTGELSARLSRYGIKRALLSHTTCVRYDPAAGNHILLEALGDLPGFFGAVALVPQSAGGSPWTDELRSLIAARVRAVRLFPALHRFLLSDEPSQALLASMQDLRLPLILWHTQTRWRDIGQICSRFPRLPVIVEGAGKKLFYDNRIYYPMLQRLPNLLLELHNVTNYLGLDDMVRRFGSAHFLFGSYFPHEEPGSVTMLLTHGDLPDDDRLNIAGRNLQRLIDEVDPR
ncbi:MAG: amidohydrolase family protein [Pirellulales bacterium]|nr:amidohydrolase family protein [Pirellulales bacterium]